MVLGNDIIASAYAQLEAGGISRPVGLSCKLFELQTAGGPAVQDNATRITNPTTQITAATRQPLIADVGTILRLMLGYDDGLTGITDMQCQVFGRADDDDPWRRLKNNDEQTTITIVTDTTEDAEDGTLKYTDANLNAHAIDLDGCKEVVVGNIVALAGGGSGVVSNSVLYGWVI